MFFSMTNVNTWKRLTLSKLRFNEGPRTIVRCTSDDMTVHDIMASHVRCSTEKEHLMYHLFHYQTYPCDFWMSNYWGCLGHMWISLCLTYEAASRCVQGTDLLRETWQVIYNVSRRKPNIKGTLGVSFY